MKPKKQMIIDGKAMFLLAYCSIPFYPKREIENG
jgi:hypothetical protein